MTERFAYFAFLAVMGGALVVLTLGLAAIGFLLIRQNRKAKKP